MERVKYIRMSKDKVFHCDKCKKAIDFDSLIPNTITGKFIVDEKANKVYAEAKAGANFSALAKSNSDDPSAANGGDMGWIAAKDLFAVFAQAIELYF